MASLPDGTTIQSKHTEGWEVSDYQPPTGQWSSRLTEPWDLVFPPIMDPFTISASESEVVLGSNVTLSGQSLGDGSPVDADLVQTAPDGTESVIATVSPDGNGDWSYTLTAPRETGDYEFHLRNDKMESKHSEGWES